MKKVTVIIVNWNCKQSLHACLSSLLEQSTPPNKIIVVDNGSNDDSIATLNEFNNIIILEIGKNIGFAAANNRAIDLCDTEWIALLNPDAFADKNWLQQLTTAADTHPDISAFGSKQIIYGSDNMLDGFGDSYHISGLFWRNYYGKTFDIKNPPNTSSFAPCACAALYRKSALLEVGGFDEDFFCYAEDVDLGFRLKLAGHKAMVVPDAIVHHIGSASSGGKHNDFSIYHGHRNLVWTFTKNMPTALFWTLLPLHIGLNLTTIIYFSIKGKGRVIIKAKWDALKGLPNAWEKRKPIQLKRKSSHYAILKSMHKGLIK